MHDFSLLFLIHWNFWVPDLLNGTTYFQGRSLLSLLIYKPTVCWNLRNTHLGECCTNILGLYYSNQADNRDLTSHVKRYELFRCSFVDHHVTMTWTCDLWKNWARWRSLLKGAESRVEWVAENQLPSSIFWTVPSRNNFIAFGKQTEKRLWYIQHTRINVRCINCRCTNCGMAPSLPKTLKYFSEI